MSPVIMDELILASQKHLAVSAAVSGLAIMAAAFQLPAAKEFTISRKYLLLLSAALLSNGIWTVTISTCSRFWRLS